MQSIKRTNSREPFCKKNSPITIIIVNWNAGAQLAAAVKSIAQHHANLVSSVVIVDNASTDNSISAATALTNLPFSFQIVRSLHNLGFASGCNHGAKNGSSPYLLFLNPDAALYPDTLNKAMAFMQSPANAQVGICGVQLKDETGHVARSCARFPHPLGFLAHALGVVRFFPRFGHFMADWPHDQTREVDHVIGAFFLVRRAVFEGLGGFDERFFVYLEDLDFSYRAHKAGWKTMFLADAQAFHAGGGTSNQIKARRLFYSLRSRLLYAHKHFSLGGAWVVMLSTLLLEPLTRTGYALVRGSWPAVKETWSGYGMLYRWLPQWALRGMTR